MMSKADAVVIGSGGLGAATAYYLSKRKGLSVALVDKHDIALQTSPRAAGCELRSQKRLDDQPHQGRLSKD